MILSVDPIHIWGNIDDIGLKVHPIAFSVTKLDTYKSGKKTGNATGFFYMDDNRIFLVTNRHVIDDKNGVDSLELYLHKSQTDLKINTHYKIPLYLSGKPIWKCHTQFKDADIALIELKKDLFDNYVIGVWDAHSCLPKSSEIDLAENVFIMGYPLGIFDQINKLPILRRAMIASMYGIDFDGNQCFLTDANLHIGMSGAPVIVKENYAWTDHSRFSNEIYNNSKYYLIGVHSSTFKKPNKKDKQSLRLGQTWYCDIIHDIIKEL